MSTFMGKINNMKIITLILLCVFAAGCKDKLQISYSQYTSSRYGFSIEYPSNFKVTETSDNDDSILFQSPDGKTEMMVGGLNNDIDEIKETAVSRYNKELSEHSPVSYKRQEDNWFVISWIEGDTIVYEKDVRGKGSANTFWIKYPKSQKNYYKPIISHIVASFKTPEVDSPH